MHLTLRTTIIMVISTTIIITSVILWLLFERSHKSIHDQSLDNMASILSLITYDAKWRILMGDEYDKEMLKYFADEIWNRNENLAWVSIYEKESKTPIFHIDKPGHDNIDMDHLLDNMIAKYRSTGDSSHFVSEDYLPRQLKVFLYPVYGPTFELQDLHDDYPIATEQLLFEENRVSQAPVIGYVLIGISIKEITDNLNQVFWTDVCITLAVIMLGIIIGYLVTRYLTQNVTSLVHATQKIAEGDFTSPSPTHSPYREIGELEQAFNSMVEEIKEVDKLKETFLVNMSHELRAPLHSIIGLSGSLIKDDVDFDKSKYRQALSVIYTEGNQLLSQINPILDLAKTRAGKMEVQHEEIDLQEIIDEVSSATQAVIQSKHKSIELHSELLNPGLIIHTDRDKLKNILHNILSNAVKFTESGRIELSVWSEDNDIMFKVKDTGIGIKQKDIPRVFQRFQQVGHSLTSKEEGIGIGMSLSREYVHLLGGEIWLESEFGEGSSFYFKVPRTPEIFNRFGVSRVQKKRVRIFSKFGINGHMQKFILDRD